MRTSGLSSTPKLWGRIDQDLQPGSYEMIIESKYNVGQWGGEKEFHLTTITNFGGKNFTLPVLLLIASFVCLAAVVALCIRSREYVKSIDNSHF